MSNKVLFLVLILLLAGFCSFVFAEEEFVITTYYPSPYGSYNELQVYRSVRYMAINKDGITDPKEGELVYDSSEDQLYLYNGSKWVAQGGGAPVVATFYGMANCPTAGGTWTKLYDGYITTFGVGVYGSASSTSPGGGSTLCVTGLSGAETSSAYQFWVQAFVGNGIGGWNRVPCCVCIRTE